MLHRALKNVAKWYQAMAKRGPRSHATSEPNTQPKCEVQMITANRGSKHETRNRERASSKRAGASIFERYYGPESFVDRYQRDASQGVDVIIPVMHTNELWRTNLLSIYREIPVRRLILGDAGCVDQTVETAKEFPRVEVYDHSKFVSLGFSLRKLIEEVETEWFVYLHSDVYLPPGWFEAMRKHQGQYDWFECKQQLTVLLDFPVYDETDRPYSGSQMGRTAAFQNVLPKIDDDYLYRNEDIILAHLVERDGFRYGRVDETFHYHQQMTRKSKWERNVRASLSVDMSEDEEIRTCMMQAKGIIKYMEPSLELLIQVKQNVDRLEAMGVITWRDFKKWIVDTNPLWLEVHFPHATWEQRIWALKHCLSVTWGNFRIMLNAMKGFVKSHYYILRALYNVVLPRKPRTYLR